MDYENQSFEENILYQASIWRLATNEDVIRNPSNVLLLRTFYKQNRQKTYSMKENVDLFEALSTNLMKNSRQIRLVTLQILLLFE